MIREVIVKDAKDTPVDWFDKVDYLKAGPISFGPGLNVLYGPNGSGKSTLILALARLFHAEQSGASVITSDSLQAIVDRGKRLEDPTRVRGGLLVDHDGGHFSYFDASAAPGLIGGMAAFDFDFLELGIQSIFNAKASSGQSQASRLSRVLGSPGVPFVDRVPRAASEAAACARQFLLGAPRPGKPVRPVMVLDEPERSLAGPARYNLWNMLITDSLDKQIIVATHDPMVLWLPPLIARFIETRPGYRDGYRRCLDEMRKWEELDRPGKAVPAGEAPKPSAKRTKAKK